MLVSEMVYFEIWKNNLIGSLQEEPAIHTKYFLLHTEGYLIGIDYTLI